jgi:hypothetical protein
MLPSSAVSAHRLHLGVSTWPFRCQREDGAEAAITADPGRTPPQEGTMKCRRSVAELTPLDKSRLVQAFLDLKDPVKSPSKIPAAAAAVTAAGGTPNRYDDYVWMHNTVGFGAHRGPAFGPWHREFLFQLEHDLQQVSGDPEMTIPYWDWTTARATTDAGWPFTNDLMGGFGNAGPGPTTGFVTTGSFSNPATWRINIRRGADADLQLKRSRGIPAASDLPVRDDVLFSFGIGVAAGATWPQVYDLAPWNDTSTPTNTQILSSFRKTLERLLHDGVHVWVGDAWEFVGSTPGDGGHMTFPAVSVNDPIFWLHHCNVDRIWSIWQRKVPGSGYQPTGTGTANAGHNGGDVMSRFADPSWFNVPVHQHPVDVEDHHALGYWYHSDPPEVTPDSLSVAFGPVPELLTTFMPATFTVATCQPVSFAITNVTGANFSPPAGQGVVVVDEEPGSDTTTARVYVQFQANGATNVAQAGSVTIQATVVDHDGYDTAAPGDTLVVGTWTLNLSATPVPRPSAAVALVLDRSGSMSLGAGVAGSRYDMLKSSLAVVRDVMRPIDGIGVVTFDDVTTTLDQITAMGPAVVPSAPGTGREALDQAIASPDLAPRNLTGIGQGIIDGAAVLDAERLTVGTPFQRFALCVMTDGNENVAPMVADPAVTAAITPYADAIYAVGLGQPGGVSDAVLTSISNYMLITGDITAAERRFRLTKYFLQILAGITRTAIVVDPQGDLQIGSEHRIPFVLSEHDVEVDVVVLCPLAPLVEMALEAPDGTVIDAGFAAPTVERHEHLDDVFYRLTLPVAPGMAVAGRWTAVLRLTKESVQKHADDRDAWRERIRQLRATGTLPYSLVVQSWSNLRLEVGVKPALCLTGESVDLYATLRAYEQPFTGPARVTALVTDDQGGTTKVPLQPAGPGRFRGAVTPQDPGAHVVRFVATGGVGRNRFTREETRTVTAYRGEIPKGTGSPSDDGRRDRRPDDERRLAARRGDHMADPDDAVPEDFGLVEQVSADDAAMAMQGDGGHGDRGHGEGHDDGHADVEHEHEHDEHDEHEGHDHANMVFTLFKRTPDGEIVELQAQDIERDTSGYDDDGHDPGRGPDRPDPGEAGPSGHHH